MKFEAISSSFPQPFPQSLHSLPNAGFFVVPKKPLFPPREGYAFLPKMKSAAMFNPVSSRYVLAAKVYCTQIQQPAIKGRSMRFIQAVRDDVETASGSVDALCDILAAASDETIRASSVRALLQPVARQLNMAASRMADHVEPPTAIG